MLELFLAVVFQLQHAATESELIAPPVALQQAATEDQLAPVLHLTAEPANGLAVSSR